jgi:hypothetical protein
VPLFLLAWYLFLATRRSFFDLHLNPSYPGSTGLIATKTKYSIVFMEFLPHFAALGVTASAVGLLPRIGPGRATWIAVRSRFGFKRNPESLRSEEISLLKRRIAIKECSQEYFVVTGEKGVGKSCYVNSVNSKTAGYFSESARNP